MMGLSLSSGHASRKVAIGCLLPSAVACLAIAGSFRSGLASAGAFCPIEGYLDVVDPPELGGSLDEGDGLTTSIGTWVYRRNGTEAAPNGFRYSWYRDGVLISGATSSSYTVVASDAGHVLKAHVFAFIGTPCGFVGNADSNTVMPESDNDGVAADAQADPVFDEVGSAPPAAPTPMTPTGPAPPGSYTTTSWSGEDTASDGGLNAVDSTASGTFAVSGVVVDSTTGQAVSGAAATLTTSDGTTQPLTATTGAEGGFAFMNVPSSTAYTHQLQVTAPGYGAYTLAHVNDTIDDTFQTTVLLGTTPQSWEDSILASPDGQVAQTAVDFDLAASGHDYYSTARMPPTIRVHEYKLNPDCSKYIDPSTSQPVSLDFLNVNYRFYVLHVAAGEIDGNAWPRPAGSPPSAGYFQQQTTTAVFSAIANYGWWQRLSTPGSQQAIVDNSTAYQCFARHKTLPNRSVRPIWRDWVDDALKNRIARIDSPNKLTFTEYKSGGQASYDSVKTHCIAATATRPKRFTDPAFASAQQLQQLGGKAAEQECGLNQVGDWKRILNYYYQPRTGADPIRIGRVLPGMKPKKLSTLTANNVITPIGSIKFAFLSEIRGINIAWRYKIVRSGTRTGQGTLICCQKKNFGNVIVSKTYVPPADPGRPGPYARCYFYRITAVNPKGQTKYVWFSSPTNTVPGTNNQQICPA